MRPLQPANLVSVWQKGTAFAVNTKDTANWLTVPAQSLLKASEWSRPQPWTEDWALWSVFLPANMTSPSPSLQGTLSTHCRYNCESLGGYLVHLQLHDVSFEGEWCRSDRVLPVRRCSLVERKPPLRFNRHGIKARQFLLKRSITFRSEGVGRCGRVLCFLVERTLQLL